MFARPSSLLVALLVSALALAVPIPVIEGDVVLVKPKHFEPAPAGVGNVGRHPAVVLSNPDSANKIKLTVISNNPRDPVTKPAEDYGLGAGQISIGTPKVADVANVKPATQEPKQISAENLAKLKSDINDNCGAGLVRRDGSSCKMRVKPAAHGATNKKTPTKAPAKAAARVPAANQAGGATKPAGRGATNKKAPTKTPAKAAAKVPAPNKAGGTRKPAGRGVTRLPRKLL